MTPYPSALFTVLYPNGNASPPHPPPRFPLFAPLPLPSSPPSLPRYYFAPRTLEYGTGRQNTASTGGNSVVGSFFFFFRLFLVLAVPVFNYSLGRGGLEVYALYGNVIDYNCPLNINQVYWLSV